MVGRFDPPTAALGRRMRALAGIAVVATLWWTLPGPGNVLLPRLSGVLLALYDLSGSGGLWRDIMHSTLRITAGVLVATVAAVALGLVALAHRASVDYVAGIVELLRPIPPIAWTPVAILVFGIGSPPAVAVVALSAFFPLWLSLLHGIDSVDRRYVMAARSLGAGRLLTFRFVLLPMILPGFVQGLRLAVGMGWFSVIAAEMIGASTGLGQAIRKSALNLNMEQTYGYLLVIGLIGLLSSWSVARLTGAGGKGP